MAGCVCLARPSQASRRRLLLCHFTAPPGGAPRHNDENGSGSSTGEGRLQASRCGLGQAN